MRFALFLLLALPVAAQPFTAEIRTIELPSEDVRSVSIDADGTVWAVTANGTQHRRGGTWKRESGGPRPAQMAVARDGRSASASSTGLYLKRGQGAWERLLPRSGKRSWAPVDVRGVAFDARGRLWFASPQ